MGNNYIYGYARVSTKQQDLNRQLDMLKKYNCIEILTEKMTGTKSDRPELIRLKDKIRSGDTLVIESFSRLGRSTKDLIELVEYFEKNGIKLISIKENFDTNTPQGKLMLVVFQAFSQFERELIVQRTKEGLESARARGRKGGRPRVKEKDISNALKLYKSKQYSISEIVEMTKISQATLYRYLNKEPLKNEKNRTDFESEELAVITLNIRIENNNKFVRGKKKTRESIENYLKDYYNMEPNTTASDEYVLKIPYSTVINLEDTIFDIFNEMSNIADMNNCFIETDASCEELDLFW